MSRLPCASAPPCASGTWLQPAGPLRLPLACPYQSSADPSPSTDRPQPNPTQPFLGMPRKQPHLLLHAACLARPQAVRRPRAGASRPASFASWPLPLAPSHALPLAHGAAMGSACASLSVRLPPGLHAPAVRAHLLANGHWPLVLPWFAQTQEHPGVPPPGHLPFPQSSVLEVHFYYLIVYTQALLSARSISLCTLSFSLATRLHTQERTSN
jgi:hypothetical protein